LITKYLSIGTILPDFERVQTIVLEQNHTA
jgi:hypothetical protein